MSEIKIGGSIFKVRGIRLKERRENKLDDYGYGRFIYSPPTTPEGKIDQVKAEEGMDKLLSIIFTREEFEALDLAGGQRGLDRAWLEIIRETYGARDEEKNSSRSGSGTATPSAAPTTAGPAAA
jgi:hypothetical protein